MTNAIFFKKTINITLTLNIIINYMFKKSNIKKQLTFSYLLIPALIYFLLYALSDQVQKYIFQNPQSNCVQKNAIIHFDQKIFKKLIYNYINPSQNVPLLFIMAIPYLAHFVVPAIYMFSIFYRRKGWKIFWRYFFSLSITSMVAVIIQNAYPTPPPWIFLNLTSAGKFQFVDQHLPIKIFQMIYGANSLVCGAFPSLHVGWPTVLTIVGGINSYLGVVYMIWISTAAVYSGHHWMTDVIVGLILASCLSYLGKELINKIMKQQEKKSQITEQLLKQDLPKKELIKLLQQDLKLNPQLQYV